jgi:hypothetical protein
MNLGNTPPEMTVIRVEARKSFALGIWLTDKAGRALDITGTTIRLVAKNTPLPSTGSSDATNLFTNGEAVLTDPAIGYAQIFLQAADLDHKPNEYPLTLVMVTEGYSVTLFKGVLDIQPNSEYESVGDEYVGGTSAEDLYIALEGQNVLTVRTGPALAPGAVSFMATDLAKLDTIEEGAQVNVLPDWQAENGDPAYILNKPDLETLPPGGSPGAALVKISAADGDVDWAFIGGGGGGSGLDATGVPSGHVPTANGVDSWDWQASSGAVTEVNGLTGAVSLTADDIPNGATNVTMTALERVKLASLSASYNDLDDLPVLGTASALDVSEVLQPLGVQGADITSGQVAAARLPKWFQHEGVTYSTAAPSGGEDFDVHFQYSA